MLSDVGAVREHNEDSVAYLLPADGRDWPWSPTDIDAGDRLV